MSLSVCEIKDVSYLRNALYLKWPNIC